MRFFTDGHFVIRLHTDAKMGDPEFYTAKAETWQFRSGAWAEKPNLASKILFTGDWNPCTKDEAYALLERSGAKLPNRPDF